MKRSNDKLNDICWIGYLELNMISTWKRDGIKVMQLPKEFSLIEDYSILKWDLNACFQDDDKDKQTWSLTPKHNFSLSLRKTGAIKRKEKGFWKCCGTNWLCYILAILISLTREVQVTLKCELGWGPNWIGSAKLFSGSK